MTKELQQLDERVHWIIWFRFAFLGVILSSSFFFSLANGFQVESALYIVCGLALGLTALTQVALRKVWIPVETNAWVQVVIDLVVSTYFVWITGADQSGFAILYGLNMMAAGILLLSRGCFVTTLAAAGTFVALSILSQHRVGDTIEGASLGRLVLMTSSIVLVGSLLSVLFRNREQMARSLYRASRNLEDLSQIHTAIVSHLPTGIVLTDEEGWVIYTNDSAQKILGGKIPSGNLRDSELQEVFISKQGEYSLGSLKVMAQAVQLPENRTLILISDLTEVRALEESVRLKEKLATVGQLAAGLAHEIKNPLASLSGSIQLLKNEVSPATTEGKLMQIVLRETDRLDDLLTNFLSYAKPAQLTLTDVYFHRLVADILELLSHSRKSEDNKKILVRNEIDKSAYARADEGKMKQVFWNLIKNAMAAIEEVGEVCLVSQDVNRNGQGYLKISVRDSGVGIKDEDRARIFEPFYTNKANGTGLGLAVVYQSVQVHEGIIGVNSEYGKGSEFWLELPVIGPAKNSRESFQKGGGAYACARS